MIAIWNWEQAPMVPPITPIGLVVLRKAVRLPIPPQATNPVGVIAFPGAAQPDYQSRFHIAPSYAAQPPVSPRRRTQIPDVQTVRALRGITSQGKARPGPSPQGVGCDAMWATHCNVQWRSKPRYRGVGIIALKTRRKAWDTPRKLLPTLCSFQMCLRLRQDAGQQPLRESNAEAGEGMGGGARISSPPPTY